MKNIFLIVLLIIHVIVVDAKNYHIQPLGSDNNDGSSFAKAFLTIQKATNLAMAGDSILVYDGTYKGFDHFYKNSGSEGKPIVYFAKGRNVIINQSCGRGGDGLNIEGNDYIEVNGFKVQFIPDIAGGGEDGIRAVLANHIIIRNCEVDSCYRGIFTGYSDDFLAEYNICKRSYGEHGIYVSNNSDRVIVRYNVCFNNRRAAGVQLNPDLSSGEPGLSYDVKIYNNICYGNRIGLNLQGIYYSEVYNNLIYNNGLSGGGNGVTFFLGDAATGCNDVKFYNNTIIVPSSSQWAILATESDSLQIYNNILVSYSLKGSFNVEKSCTNYISDYNCVNDRMTQDDGATYINFQQWQSLGYDLNSQLIRDNASLFMNYSILDLRLSTNSQARNKGTNLVQQIVKEDLSLNKRPQGGAFDIGCYEYLEAANFNDIHKVHKLSYIINANFIEIINPDVSSSYRLFSSSGELVSSGVRMSKKSISTGIYFLTDMKSTIKIFIP